jgi:hypothetical protein
VAIFVPLFDNVDFLPGALTPRRLSLGYLRHLSEADIFWIQRRAAFANPESLFTAVRHSQPRLYLTSIPTTNAISFLFLVIYSNSRTYRELKLSRDTSFEYAKKAPGKSIAPTSALSWAAAANIVTMRWLTVGEEVSSIE